MNKTDPKNIKKESKKPINQKIKAHTGSHIKRIVGVLSGKGGVGKSTVTALLASAMMKQGERVGIIDADITAAKPTNLPIARSAPAKTIIPLTPKAKIILVEACVKINLKLLIDKKVGSTNVIIIINTNNTIYIALFISI